MRKFIFLSLIILIDVNVSIGQTPPPDLTPSPYHNMEKYWWYRYRLVNDFMYIDPTDSVGGSLPAQKRNQISEGTAGVGTNPHDQVYLSWQDCTTELGHLIGALAVEYRFLKDNNWPTQETENELYCTITAFDRLDQNAETFGEDINRFPYNPGAWTTSWGLAFNNNTDGPMNGFFLRDDVPYTATASLTALTRTPDFVSMHHEHFNRPGVFYDNTKLPFDPTLTTGSCVQSKYNALTLAQAPVYSNEATHVNQCAFWGSIPLPSSWPNIPGTSSPMPRYPDEESQDQVADMYLGLSLATNLLDNGLNVDGIDIRADAADAQWRIVSWIPKPATPLAFPEDWIPFTTYGGAPTAWLLKNPQTMRCVFAAYPASYNTPEGCITSGAWGPEIYCYSASRAVTKSFGAHYPSNLSECYALEYLSDYPSYYLDYQALQNIPIMHPYTDDIEFADIYTAVSGAWQIPLFPWPFTFLNPNNSWVAIRNHSMDEYFCEPHLPLIYRINFSKPGIGFIPELHDGGISYVDLFNWATECGPFHYSHSDYGNGEWSGSDRLAEWFHRDGLYDVAPDDVQWNGIDYLLLFSLYAYHMGSSYLPSLINPYWTDNYDVNYPDGLEGTTSNQLTLNWLEHCTFMNHIYAGGNVVFRGAKCLEMNPGSGSIPGFEVDYGGNFLGYVLDYPCSSSMGSPDAYYFATDNSGPIEYSPTHIPFVGKKFSPSDSLNSNTEDSLANIPYPPELANSLKDSLKTYLLDKDPHLLNKLIQMGILDQDGNFINKPYLPDSNVNYKDIVELYPNPTHSISNLTYQLFGASIIDIQLKNELGEDLSNFIEPYLKDEPAGKYSIRVLADKLTPGVYFVRMAIGNQIIVKKLTVL